MEMCLGRPLRYSTGTAVCPDISAKSKVAVRPSDSLVKARLRTTFGRSGSSSPASAFSRAVLGLSTRQWTATPFSVSLLGTKMPSTCM